MYCKKAIPIIFELRASATSFPNIFCKSTGKRNWINGWQMTRKFVIQKEGLTNCIQYQQRPFMQPDYYYNSFKMNTNMFNNFTFSFKFCWYPDFLSVRYINLSYEHFLCKMTGTYNTKQMQSKKLFNSRNVLNSESITFSIEEKVLQKRIKPVK